MAIGFPWKLGSPFLENDAGLDGASAHVWMAGAHVSRIMLVAMAGARLSRKKSGLDGWGVHVSIKMLVWMVEARISFDHPSKIP